MGTDRNVTGHGDNVHVLHLEEHIASSHGQSTDVTPTHFSFLSNTHTHTLFSLSGVAGHKPEGSKEGTICELIIEVHVLSLSYTHTQSTYLLPVIIDENSLSSHSVTRAHTVYLEMFVCEEVRASVWRCVSLSYVFVVHTVY